MKISIIGAGVSGICCALILKKMGFDVTIYSKDEPLSLSSSPSHVSLHPAASVIPHSVSHANLTSIFRNSLSFFDVLFSDDFIGLTVHKHYELFSEKMDDPEYKNQVKEFNLLNDSQLQTILNHPEITLTTGWEFDSYFTDWALYFPALIQKYRALGGSIIQKKIEPENLSKLDSDIIINCAEIGGPLIAGEEFEPILYRGHIVHVKDAPLLTEQNGKTISYNFTPPLNFYHSEKGNPQDLYCYPREDGWILGGSRQMGTLSNSGEWIGENVIKPSTELNGKIIPEQILSLHQPIIKNAFGFDLNSFPNKTAKIGYRFMGNKTEGLRLDLEEKLDRLIIHNYGHGGAGVTLSWGCAFEVAALLTKQLKGEELELAEVLSVFKF